MIKLSIILSLIGLVTGAGFYAHAQWVGRYQAGYKAGQQHERNDLAGKLNANRKSERERITRIAAQQKENEQAKQNEALSDFAHMSANLTAERSQLTWLQQHSTPAVPSAGTEKTDPSISAGGTGLINRAADRSDLAADRAELGNEAFDCKAMITLLNRVRLGWIDYGTNP